MSRELEGQVAVVAGAGPGVGRACAAAFARAGASVVVAARDSERLAVLATELTEEIPDSVVVPLTFDLGESASCVAMIEQTCNELGGLDHLVNVATIGGGGPIDTADLDNWRRSFDANVLGTLELSRSAARMMAERGGGSIVQISTMGAHSLPKNLASYTSTKQAMVSASMTMAKEVGPSGVRVNVVSPGYITGWKLDRMMQSMADTTGETLAGVSNRLAASASLRRHVDPADIAEAVLFLTGPRGRSITGVDLPVTAGQ